MKSFTAWGLLLAGIILVFAGGCGLQKPEITGDPYDQDQYTVYVKGVLSHRDTVMTQWQQSAKETCKGRPYTVLQGPTTTTIEGVSIQIEGKIKCINN